MLCLSRWIGWIANQIDDSKQLDHVKWINMNWLYSFATATQLLRHAMCSCFYDLQSCYSYLIPRVVHIFSHRVFYIWKWFLFPIILFNPYRLLQSVLNLRTLATLNKSCSSPSMHRNERFYTFKDINMVTLCLGKSGESPLFFFYSYLRKQFFRF